MVISSRYEAGTALAAKLLPYRLRNALVLAIPRSGVPVAKIVAEAIDGELDVLLVRKLVSPAGEAIGFVGELGDLFLDDRLSDPDVTQAYLRRAIEDEINHMRYLRALFTPGRSAIDLRERTVIVVDDLVDTGFTMAAALHVAGVQEPGRLVCGAGVLRINTIKRFCPLADDVVYGEACEVIDRDRLRLAWGGVSDEDVVRALRFHPLAT